MTARDDSRRPFGIAWESNRLPVGPGPGEVTSFDPRYLDFGRYAGRSIEELARTDPDYLEWLSQHPSGARYRGEIARVRLAIGATTRLWPQLG
jgi:broad specificity phosphatase PhoE